MVFDRLVGWDRVAELLPPDVMTMLDGRFLNAAGNETMTGTLFLTGTAPQLQIAPSAAGAGIVALQSSAAGQFCQLVLSSGGAGRWALVKDSVAEGGGNAGSNFAIQRLNDAGAALDNPFTIVRSTGIASFLFSPTAPTPALNDNTTKLATTAFVNVNAVENFSGQDLTLWKGTQAQYNALGAWDSNTVYAVTP